MCGVCTCVPLCVCACAYVCVNSSGQKQVTHNRKPPPHSSPPTGPSLVLTSRKSLRNSYPGLSSVCSLFTSKVAAGDKQKQNHDRHLTPEALRLLSTQWGRLGHQGLGISFHLVPSQSSKGLTCHCSSSPGMGLNPGEPRS